jgi:replicative DNA helicase
MDDNKLLYNQELEKGYLSSVLSSPDSFGDYVEKTNVDLFHNKMYREIYKKIESDYLETGKISRTKIMLYGSEKFGQEKFNKLLNNNFLNPLELSEIISKLRECSERRKVKRSLEKSYKYLSDSELKQGQFKSKIQDEVFKATSKNLEEKLIYDVESVAYESFERYQERQQGKAVEKIRTGIYSLDSITGGGLSKKHLSILAGRPSMGKTAMSLRLLSSTLRASNAKSLFISLEMDRVKLLDRILIQKSKTKADDYYKTKNDPKNKVVKKQINSIETARNWLHDKPLKITDKRGLKINDIKSIARKTDNIFNGDLDLIIIDYLTEINISSVDGRFDKGIAEAVRELRSLAAELDVHLILLHQINRAFKGRSNKRPELSDLRDSGEIEEKADNVFFVHRPQYYECKEKGIDEPVVQNDAELLIAKQREGATGAINMVWYPEIVYFQDFHDKKVRGPVHYLCQ